MGSRMPVPRRSAAGGPLVRLTLGGFLLSIVAGALLMLPLLNVPALAFFAWRYVRLPLTGRGVIGAAIVAEILTLAALVAFTEPVITVYVILGLLFPFLYLAAGLLSRGAARGAGEAVDALLDTGQDLVRAVSGGTGGASQREGYSRLLEIEQAGSVEERRLLVIREFCRLAETALEPNPADRDTWHHADDLRDLERQAGLLQASATDTNLWYGEEGDAAALPDRTALMDAILKLREYVGAQASIAGGPAPSMEQLRILARERGNLQRMYDEVARYLLAS